MIAGSLYAKRNHFSQHPQAIVKEADFAALRVVPADRNFAGAQSGAVRQIKQLDIEGKTVDASGFDNRPTNVEAERFETALRIPKWQAGGDTHNKVEDASSLFASPGLMLTDQAAVEGA
jgi:hypothetical protein